ncbi:MAG: hypothetical protein II749_06190 [Clostridia bacterium]|nr:hypothetical protein [Clostridia bacterium]
MDRKRIYESLKRFRESGPHHVLCGFDGYIDTLVRLRKSPLKEEYFETVEDFASFISKERNQSSDISVVKKLEHYGGNAPIFAYSAAEKGITVFLVGAMGYPVIDSHFPSHSRIHMYSVAQPAETYALEFSDGKVMLGDIESLKDMDWNFLKERVGSEKLKELFTGSKLILFSNWSGLIHSNDMLSGICEDILPLPQMKDRIFMFDLADPSGRTDKELDKLFSYMKRIAGTCHVILGLNEKEFRIVAAKAYGREVNCSEDILMGLKEKLGIQEIVVHGLDYAMTAALSTGRAEGRFVQDPCIVTGGGDNFNAGYVLGKLAGLEPEECALTGNISSYIYVRYGRNATIDDILADIYK